MGRTGGGTWGRSMRSTWREGDPGGHHPKVGTLGKEDWRRDTGPEYEEYTDRGGSRGTSPGGRYTRGGRAGGGEDSRRDTGQEYEEAPGERHPEVTVVNIFTTVGVHLY